MDGIEAVGPEFYGRHDSFRSLEELEFKSMHNWKEWTSPNGNDGEFPCLRRLMIYYCPKLLGQLPSNLSSLKELYVIDCNAMLFKSMVDLTSLTKFRIERISEVTCLPKSFIQSLTTLETLSINICEDLTCLWEEGAEIEQNLLPFNLKYLSIRACRALESLLENLGLCTPNLKDLTIGWCENFKSLPSTMYQLKSLQHLWMIDCPSIEFIPDGGLPPNLTELQLWCKNLKRLPNTMYQLTSLQSLDIPGGALMSLQRLTIDQKSPLDIVLPSSLTFLHIWDEENLESIPGGLFQNLSSLEELWIINCPKLRSLPREAFPPSLGRLCIRGCPHLKRQRFEEKGDYWTLTWSIPNVEIHEDVYNVIRGWCEPEQAVRI
ncbi:hypothetical protein SLA2020_300740 [Shorea laevis]